MTRRGRR